MNSAHQNMFVHM